MCGAFSIYNDITMLSKRFGAQLPKQKLSPRYNARPSQPIPVIFNTDQKQIGFALWGIHPSYDKTGKMFFINARNDSLVKPTWKKALQERRCLILADGFYEWKKTGSTKIPFRFEMKTKMPFAFAGLWQEETNAAGQKIPHCVIITTEPNNLVSGIHNRMPAILIKDLEREWLNPDVGVEGAMRMLHPFNDSEMTAYPISTLVNSPKNDVAEIIEPVESSK